MLTSLITVNQPPGVQVPTGLDWETFVVAWDPEFSVLREACAASLVELEVSKGRQLSVADILNFSFESCH